MRKQYNFKLKPELAERARKEAQNTPYRGSLTAFVEVAIEEKLEAIEEKNKKK